MATNDNTSYGDHYGEAMLKGRMAETLVEEMLKRSGNAVYRFGYEAVLQNLVQLESGFDKNAEVSEKLRAIPDFIVLDKTGKPEFVEVKFRFDPDMTLHDETIETLERVEKYWNPLMVFVNCTEKPYFRICKAPYFKNFSMPKKGLLFEPLQDSKEWHISEHMYAEYEALVEKYLTPTLKRSKA